MTKKKIKKEKEESSQEKEKDENDEEKNNQKNNSFCIRRPKLSTVNDDDENEENEREEKKIFSRSISYFDSFKEKFEQLMSFKKNKKYNIEDYFGSYEEKDFEEEEEEEENEGKRKRIKRAKKNINIKGVKGLFMDENNGEIEDINEYESYESQKIDEIPKPMGWEEKFELFKQYIHDLKGMNDEQFNYVS